MMDVKRFRVENRDPLSWLDNCKEKLKELPSFLGRRNNRFDNPSMEKFSSNAFRGDKWSSICFRQPEETDPIKRSWGRYLIDSLIGAKHLVGGREQPVSLLGYLSRNLRISEIVESLVVEDSFKDASKSSAIICDLNNVKNKTVSGETLTEHQKETASSAVSDCVVPRNPGTRKLTFTRSLTFHIPHFLNMDKLQGNATFNFMMQHSIKVNPSLCLNNLRNAKSALMPVPLASRGAKKNKEPLMSRCTEPANISSVSSSKEDIIVNIPRTSEDVITCDKTKKSLACQSATESAQKLTSKPKPKAKGRRPRHRRGKKKRRRMNTALEKGGAQESESPKTEVSSALPDKLLDYVNEVDAVPAKYPVPKTNELESHLDVVVMFASEVAIPQAIEDNFVFGDCDVWVNVDSRGPVVPNGKAIAPPVCANTSIAFIIGNMDDSESEDDDGFGDDWDEVDARWESFQSPQLGCIDVVAQMSPKESSSRNDEADCSPLVHENANDRLKIINAQWEKAIKTETQRKNSSSKKVCFASGKDLLCVHPLHKWAYAYQAARAGPWEACARDRVRFQNRIEEVNTKIGHVFAPDHRRKMYKRFHEEKT